MYLYFVLPLGSCAPASFASAFAIFFSCTPLPLSSWKSSNHARLPARAYPDRV